ncbi:hypothetical protein GOBAR_AA02364 [Gossypium barbadense]|uniref:DUF4283 domain-containing protein n=1 Tax=Gossypium barbadense TaxID=3634 RepID=A0A2P5YRP7_GOSBA|nr:hypothetical protein GOBAR_AA02364 [Gossypium barbadense]
MKKKAESGNDNTLNENHNTKKVRFKGLEEDMSKDMAMDLSSVPAMSWKDNVLERGSFDSIYEEDFSFMEGDITRSTVNGIPTINFSERIQHILLRDMEITVVVKLLGQNLAYTTLHNMIYSLWKLSLLFHLIYVENGYFLVKFQTREDYEKVLTKGRRLFLGNTSRSSRGL